MGWRTGCLHCLEEPEILTGLAGLRSDSSAQGRGKTSRSHSSHPLQEGSSKARAKPLKRSGQNWPARPPPGLPLPLSPEEQSFLPVAKEPATAPHRTHPEARGRPRGEGGEPAKDNSAGWKQAEAGRKTYRSLQSDHLRASRGPEAKLIRPGWKSERGAD